MAIERYRCISKRRSITGSLLVELETNLLLMYIVVNDSEKKLLEDHVVEEWLSRLIEATFDAEPLINKIKRGLEAEGLQHKLRESKHTSEMGF
ncbi:hypothetical protein TorRG33x02_248190 [Trema orientale]|uniref:Disease resistance N-terminal domain-containing protein n=1 Tax=Trema orientale TaxID=63057 RepID=A0A2P5DL66_TREOI|nr:hypothetical protein TorRG33x02_248190 [Trema orientale]